MRAELSVTRAELRVMWAELWVTRAGRGRRTRRLSSACFVMSSRRSAENRQPGRHPWGFWGPLAPCCRQLCFRGLSPEAEPGEEQSCLFSPWGP